MADKPEALLLADDLQEQAVWEALYGPSRLRDLLPEAAAELRRLHAVNAELLERADPTQTPCDIAEDGVCEVIDCCRNPAQQEQEPVAWQWLNTGHFRKKLPVTAEPGVWTPLYTAPPRREWQSLTDTDIARVFRAVYGGARFGPSEKEFARAVEAALKEKNA